MFAGRGPPRPITILGVRASRARARPRGIHIGHGRTAPRTEISLEARAPRSGSRYDFWKSPHVAVRSVPELFSTVFAVRGRIPQNYSVNRFLFRRVRVCCCVRVCSCFCFKIASDFTFGFAFWVWVWFCSCAWICVCRCIWYCFRLRVCVSLSLPPSKDQLKAIETTGSQTSNKQQQTQTQKCKH